MADAVANRRPVEFPSHEISARRCRPSAAGLPCRRHDVRVAPGTAGGADEPQPLQRTAMAQHRSAPRRANEGGRGASRASRTPSTSAWSTAASGRPPTPAAPGSRSSTSSRPDRSAGSPSRHPIRTSSMSRPAKGCRVQTWPSATASTDRPTPARPGRTSACATRSRFRSSRSIRATRTGIFVAALGHPYGPNEERGIFRSTDGGQHFERVLFKDVNTGGKDVDIDPSNPDIVYATMWEQRQGPWENGAWQGTNGGIFKSTDGGTTWKQLTQGLPRGLINAELGIAPSSPRRIFATVEAGDEGTGDLPIRRRRRDLDAHHRRQASHQPHQRGGAARAPDRSRDGHRHRHRQLQVDRRRQDVRAVQGRARRRRQPEHLVEPDQPRHHAARRRSGRGRDAERRRDLELVVHAADRGALSTS